MLWKNYTDSVKRGIIETNEFQAKVISELEPILRAADQPLRQPKSWIAGLTLWSKQPEHKRGAYIYGEVGSGKTMLMDLCYESSGLPAHQKQRLHFNQFMAQAHSSTCDNYV